MTFFNRHFYFYRNGLPTENITTTTQKMVVDVSSKTEEHASFIALFRTPRLRARTIAICFNWFVCGLCFFGVSQYIGHVSGNIFTNVAISAAIQVIYFSLHFFRQKLDFFLANILSYITRLIQYWVEIAYYKNHKKLSACLKLGYSSTIQSFTTRLFVLL